MPRRQEGHGAALQNSLFVAQVAFWIAKDPRLTAGQIRRRLIDNHGADAKFSEPTIRDWMANYFPKLMLALTDKEAAVKTMVSMNDTVLFGKVADALSYHLDMRALLETKMQSLMADYDRLEKDIVDTDKQKNEGESVIPLRIQIIRTKVQVQAKIKDLAKELREHNRYIDEFQRVHDYGERMGEMLEALVSSTYELLFPYIPSEFKVEARKDFDLSWKTIGKDFGVPPSKVMG